METAPGDPGDGLASAGGDAQLISRGLVVCLDLAAQLDADSGDVLKARTVGGPDAERVAVDADVRLAGNAAGELAKLRTTEDGQDAVKTAGEAQLQDLRLPWPCWR